MQHSFYKCVHFFKMFGKRSSTEPTELHFLLESDWLRWLHLYRCLAKKKVFEKKIPSA